MNEERGLADWLTRPRTIVAIWAAYAVLSINQSFVWAVVANRERPWHQPLTWALATALVWAMLTPLIMKLVREKRIGRDTWRQHIGWHVAAVLLAGLADAGADQAARVISGMPTAFWADYFRKIDIVAFFYTVIAGATHAADYHDLYERGKLRAAQLQSQLKTSQLEILKSQLQPHFLFNTLNAINALIHEDPHAADRVLTRLAELLRMTLNAGSAQQVTLAQEIQFIRVYLEIQQARLGERMSVTFLIDDEVLDKPVPALLLQPLVENAVRHGIGPVPAGGSILIEGWRQVDRLILRVADDGVGMPSSKRVGIGLSNVAGRLQHLYGDQHRLDIRPRAGGGTVIELALPMSAPEPAQADLRTDYQLAN